MIVLQAWRPKVVFHRFMKRHKEPSFTKTMLCIYTAGLQVYISGEGTCHG